MTPSPELQRTWVIATLQSTESVSSASTSLNIYIIIYFKHCTSRSGKVAVELIRDLPNLESLLPNTLSEAETQYTVPSKATSAEQQKLEDETNVNYLMATILYRTAHTFKTPPSYTDAELSQR